MGQYILGSGHDGNFAIESRDVPFVPRDGWGTSSLVERDAQWYVDQGPEKQVGHQDAEAEQPGRSHREAGPDEC